MRKKYFFFDIDGTLTDDATHKIVPSALTTLHALEEKGHFVSIASGRAHYKTVSFTDPIGIHNIVCCGGACLVINGKTVMNIPLPKEKALHIIEKAEENHIGWMVMLNDSDEMYFKDYRFLEQAGLRTELTTYIYQPDMDYRILPEIFKVYVALTKEQEEYFSWSKDLSHLRMGKGYVNYQHDRKKDGILDMMKYLKAPLEDVVVFGDGVNDLVMFDERWTSIAMGNGVDALKAKATYVTADNTDDGIEKACKHFGWID